MLLLEVPEDYIVLAREELSRFERDGLTRRFLVSIDLS